MCIQKCVFSLDSYIAWQSDLINPTLDDAYVFVEKFKL